MIQAPSRRLLLRILEQPDLVSALHRLPPAHFSELVRHVGLEDAGEILTLATREQVEQLLDHELWRSDRAGLDESFDAARFAVWLEVLLEADESHAVQRLLELPEELLLLGFQSQVLVIDIDALALQMSDRGEDDDANQLEKALESCLHQELEEYRIIAKRAEGWDAVIAALVALDRDQHSMLRRLLERCAAADSEFIADNGGLYDVLTSEEMLETDAAAEREDRRARAGYVTPSSATSFLALARRTPLAEIVAATEQDPVTRAYFRELERTPRERTRAPATPQISPRPDAVDRLEKLLFDAGVIDARSSVPKLTGTLGKPAALLGRALVELASVAPEVHAERLEELAFLANVLIAGTSVDRTLRPADAVSRAVDVCERGLRRLLEDGPGDALAQAVHVLRRTGAPKLFRIGWNLAGG